VPRGGSVPVRDPAMLSLLDTPFDPFAHHPDMKRADDGQVHWNLPNLGVRLWRLKAYRLPATRPLPGPYTEVVGASSGEARFLIGFDLDRLGRPVRLFNTYRAPPVSAAGIGQTLTEIDTVPGPIPWARLCSASEAGRPEAYVGIDRYTPGATPGGLDLGDTGLMFHLPDNAILDGDWSFRGENLCAWDACLIRPLAAREIAIDPEIGRVILGVASEAEALALRPGGATGGEMAVYAAYTYGAAGPVGAHPIPRAAVPSIVSGQTAELRAVPSAAWPTLMSALAGLDSTGAPVVIESRDSLDRRAHV
jgi:hypothetical protein